MIRMRKGLCVWLAALLMLPLTGCNGANRELTPQQVIKIVLENLLNIKSVSYEVNVDSELTIAGKTMATNTKTTADMTLDPMNMRLQTAVNMSNYGTTNLQMYAVQEEGGMSLYTSADGENWMKQENISTDQIAQYNMMDAVSIYLSAVANLQETGHEQIGDFDTVRYTGTLSSETFSEVLKVSGMLEQLENLGIDAETSAGFYEELGELPITLWIHPVTFLPVKYEMDLTDLIGNLYHKVLGSAADPIADTIGMSIGNAKMSCTFLGFNSVEEISVPDEAKNALMP